jgi:D-alanine-D-alanine ligase
MNITVLTYLESEDDKKYDVVVDQVASALKEGGHKVSILGIHGDVKKLVAGLSRRKPDLIFNLMEMFAENLFGEVGVAGLLDLLGIPFTGCGPGEFYLRQDKALAKKVLAFEGLLYPRFAVFTKGADFETGGNLHMPLFVKPLRCDASIGIDGRSLVTNSGAMMQRVVEIHEKVQDSALVEEYVDGREFYVGVLGNENPLALPVIEMDFSGLPEGTPRYVDRNAKFNEGTVQYQGTKSVLATVPDALRNKLHKVSLDAYRALRIRDYGRVDLRLTEDGEVYVIEVNASCYLEKSSEFAMAAGAAGIDYTQLVNRIVDLAMERTRLKPRGKLTVDSFLDAREAPIEAAAEAAAAGPPPKGD